MHIVTETDIKEYPLLSRGKVRDIYAIDDDRLLIVTTDRISAYDVVLPDPIPYKGAVLNSMTIFWMEMFKDILENHLLVTDVKDFPAPLQPYRDMLAGRAVIAKRTQPLPIECIVRGYLTGSGLKDYQATGMVSGHLLSPGLEEADELSRPLFTPSTKAEQGEHDENITVGQAIETLGRDLFDRVEKACLEIYDRAREYARARGIIIADSKFEFGQRDGKLILIDEVLTPDSSRFWPAEGYQAGRVQPSYDKQYVRDWLTSIGFDKRPPAPSIPPEIARKTSEKYLDAYARLTGASLV